MTSHYDSAKQCRVGAMDEKQFYSEAAKANGDFFRALIAAWRKQGGTLKWGAGGVGLRARIDGKEIGICFLAPAYAGKKDRIEMSMTTLSKQIGAARSEALTTARVRAAGDHFKGATMVCILDPGQLAVTAQKSLTAALSSLR